ncbi:MAG TPA: amidohydrolase family protein [Vicinamibacterales bacterium]|nr:amidohydrolase family protein [Vicinamibacterales bacterium]
MRLPFLSVALAATLAVVVSWPLVAQTAAPPAAPLMIVNAAVVDTATGAVRRGQVVVLRDGRIESVGTVPPAAAMAPRRVDVGGRYVVPGLIDAHVHIATATAMRAALESGVTTVRSAGVSHFVDVGLRDLVKRGFLPGPDVLAAGYHVRPQPAAEAFLDAPDLGDLIAGLTTPDALRRFVRFNLGRTVDWIKVLATERAGTPDTDPRKQVYSEAELALVVAEAAARGVPVLAHAHGAEGALAAVKAGVRSIEHGTYLSDETLTLMAQKGTFFDPTADVVNDLAMPGGDYDNASLQRRGQMMKPVLVDTIRRARALGVKIAAGSDTGYGPSSIARISREVLELVEAGLPALAALQSATTVNAELLKLESQIGQVRPGFEADLIVVDANPLEQPRTLLDPLLVISNGRVGLDRLSFGK